MVMNRIIAPALTRKPLRWQLPDELAFYFFLIRNKNLLCIYMKKLIVSMFICSLFSSSYSQGYEGPCNSLYVYLRNHYWDKAVAAIKDCETYPMMGSFSKYHYYKGMVYQSIYGSQDPKYQGLKDSALFYVMDSYLKAFCIALSKDSLKPAGLLADSSGLKQKLLNIDIDLNVGTGVISGLLDSSLAQLMKLMAEDKTVDEKIKQKYAALFSCFTENSAMLQRKIKGFEGPE
jgi:hypothetical protein